MEGRLLLNVVVGQSTAVLQLFTRKNQTLLVGRDALLVLDFRLDIFDGVGGLDLKGDGLAGEGFHENLHRVAFLKQKNKTLTLRKWKTNLTTIEMWWVTVSASFKPLKIRQNKPSEVEIYLEVNFITKNIISKEILKILDKLLACKTCATAFLIKKKLTKSKLTLTVLTL